MKFQDSILAKSDSYKYSHAQGYPPNTENIYSYFESRSKDAETVFFGLQYIIDMHLNGIRVRQRDLDWAKKFYAAHFGNKEVFKWENWQYIIDVHEGKLPVKIKAVPEGMVVPTGNVLLTIEATDSKCYWLTNYLETLLSQIWYSSTVCTNSREIRKIIKQYTEETSDDQYIDFKLHDFGYRGSTSVESAGIGGAAHLVNFLGTDTIAGILTAVDHYDADPLNTGFSVPAAEHSTITSWGRENEVKAFENMLDQFPTGLVAVVSDSYDIFKACSDLWGKQLKDKILARDGTLVVRPDSGNPPTTVVKVLDLLGKAFGYTFNSKNYRVLPPQVRIIQGDGIDKNMVNAILETMKFKDWASENIAFGSGGGLLQKVDRDTYKFAFKCSAALIDGEWRDVYKDPVTDPGKTSKKGRLALVNRNGKIQTIAKSDLVSEDENILQTVWENGNFVKRHTFEEIRARAQI